MSDKPSKNLSENDSLDANLNDLQNQSHKEETGKNIYYDEPDLQNLDESTIGSDGISSISNSEKEYQITKLRIFKNVYCQDCKKVCSVLILDDGSLTIECKCSKKINISVVKFKEQYLHGDIKSNPDLKDLKNALFDFSLLSRCPLHQNEKFIYYCTDCGEDICKKCMEKNASFLAMGIIKFAKIIL